jgi:hypothetical protein
MSDCVDAKTNNEPHALRIGDELLGYVVKTASKPPNSDSPLVTSGLLSCSLQQLLYIIRVIVVQNASKSDL